MKDVLTLLKPRLWSLNNRRASGRRKTFLLVGLVGLAFWIGIFAIFYRVLIYFQGVEGFGDILASKLLSMVLVTFFAILIFSSILTFLSKLYLSNDLDLIHSMPVSSEKIFLARWIESAFDSSWMVFVYSLPIFLSYGIVYEADPVFYVTVIVTILSLCIIASSISAALVMPAAVLLPAGRIRTIFLLLGSIMFLTLYLAFRLMRPERLVNPDTFMSVVIYLNTLKPSGSPWLPTTWSFDSIYGALSGSGGHTLFNLALSWSFAITMIFFVTWISKMIYSAGLSKGQTAHARRVPSSSRIGRRRTFNYFLNLFSGPTRAFLVKEVKIFFRDRTQWPQIFLVAALIAVYLYNFSVLPLERSPLETVYLQNLLSFLNVGLTAFVLTAIAARFVFPAVSIEGNAFWIVQSAPVPVWTFLWVKFFIYFFPLLFLSEILIVATNRLLQVTPFMMVLSVITTFCMVPGIVSMGVGLGAIYPDFKSGNPAQSVTSFGGLVFMILSAGFIGGIIILEAGPVYSVFMADISGNVLTTIQWIWLIGSFSIVLILCVLAIVVPMRLGGRMLLKR
jgi:ABC-2 type transport system permease protein